MNFIKRLFSKKKPKVYPTIEPHRFKEDDHYTGDNPIFNQWANEGSKSDPDYDCGDNQTSFGGGDFGGGGASGDYGSDSGSGDSGSSDSGSSGTD